MVKWWKMKGSGSKKYTKQLKHIETLGQNSMIYIQTHIES